MDSAVLYILCDFVLKILPCKQKRYHVSLSHRYFNTPKEFGRQKGFFMKVFDYDSSFMRFMSLLSRLTLINLLWLLCCIPVVTAGAATMAQHYSVDRLIDGNYSSFQNFKKGFRFQWKRATIVWLILAILSIAFFIAYQMLSAMEMQGKQMLILLAVLAYMTLFVIMLWVFPVMLHFNGSLQEILFNSFMLCFMHIPTSLLAILFYGIAGYLLLGFRLTTGLVMLFGPSLVIYANLCMFRKVFRKYTGEEDPI